MHKCFCSGKTE